MFAESYRRAGALGALVAALAATVGSGAPADAGIEPLQVRESTIDGRVVVEGTQDGHTGLVDYVLGPNDEPTKIGMSFEIDGLEPAAIEVTHPGCELIAAGYVECDMLRLTALLKGGADGIEFVAGNINGLSVRGGPGDDRIMVPFGGGLVVAHGGSGDDYLYGGSTQGAFGGPGSDDIDGNPRAVGGAGADTIWGTSGSDVIRAGGGADLVNAAGGDDVVYGGDGSDALRASFGHDTLFGGPGGDNLNSFDGRHDDVNCGLGSDLAVKDRADRIYRCESVRRGP